MNWLTSYEVCEYATTPRKALAITRKHWWQNRTATREEIDAREEIDEQLSQSEQLTGSKLCGLCQFYRRCKDCPIKINCSNKRSLWNKARKALQQYRKEGTAANFERWREAATTMHKNICSLEV
jgi:hypothetical protein